jgi:Cu(I)/Ag(I) efflux system membrane fusion protein
VKPGASVADRTEILEGLGEGETVVTTANFLLDSESRLQAAITGQASAPAPREGSPETTAGTATGAPAASKPTGKAPMPPGHRH